MFNPANQRDTQLQSGLIQNNTPSTPPNPILSANSRTSYLPPSLAMNHGYPKSPTTYGPLSPPLPPVPGNARFSSFGFGHHHQQEDSFGGEISVDTAVPVPPTPAYPAYPSSPGLPYTPHWQAPIAGVGSMQTGPVGPSVEIKRERGLGAGGVGFPPTPGPMLGAPGGFAQMQVEGAERAAGSGDGRGEPIIVSVGLLPRPTGRQARKQANGEGVESVRDYEKIYPLDQFTLDIFVYNQSSWTRRFEVSYPDRRKLRKEQLASFGGQAGKKGVDDSYGVVPLENRVRVGPLLPSTCQSVRMDFLALSPGVHSIDTLTLTDVYSGYSMNLRSVIDVVVHEHEERT